LNPLAIRQARIELARRNFWDFCNLLSPDFYTPDREHLVRLCNAFDDFYKGELLKDDGTPYKKIIVNMPPQHGKTRTLINFCQWVLGKNNEERIIAGSYNDLTAGDFSKYTRDGILQEKINDNVIVFNDIFPETKIKHGSSSAMRWALEGQHFNYLGAGIGGSLTSKGATVLIMDDPIKGAEEALNEAHLDKVWLWYTSTFLSRTSAIGGHPLEIIVMTCWSKLDPVGRILDSDDQKDWYVLRMPAIDKETNKMLCDDFLNYDRYLFLRRNMDETIFSANFDQEQIDIKGTLYKNFKTYESIPAKDGKSLFEEIRAYIDTADEGDDYLCSVIYGIYNGDAYILDVYYTKDSMETTEPETAERLYNFKVNLCKIESNSGGRGFARNVKRILSEKKDNRTSIQPFTQTKNKIARIISESAFLQEHVYFPINWHDKFPEYSRAMKTFMRSKKNKNDDAPDATTGVVENIGNDWAFA